ncbi:hypothetical protein NADFUDRAFT_46647 [Nadsonia fulvescens var. elongata DSM 6958]|uniref:Large ribosomal subunit protein mL46 n=1 Tax=Nadsonia fulvescens var. elongata DSM 6958 TaxID=857566 RepID=A0A1E3PL05_9ASCO|nr:hypothetical protein NADFUDRAFT_46647 [Nadsonia fulvescens var. elongata DSM 6958]
MSMNCRQIRLGQALGRISRSYYSTEATSHIPSSTTSSLSTEQGSYVAPSPEQLAESRSKIRAGLILSRTPIVTPEVKPFEESYYNYQQELERRLMWTFPKSFYFKKGSMAEHKFNLAQKKPIQSVKGVFYERGIPDIKLGRERRFKQEVVIPLAEEEGADSGSANGADIDSVARRIMPEPRITEADKSNDVASLSRKLDRTLYLIIKQQKTWKFPSFSLEGDVELLHEAAERGLRQIGGTGMNTWTVSSTPTAVIAGTGSIKEFFIKSHILAGQFSAIKSEIEDFAWLTKEELKEKFDKQYYETLEPVISEQ